MPLEMLGETMRQRPPPLLLDLGRRVAELRRAQGLTQEKFAERAQVSVGYVREIETGRENLGLLSLAKIAGHLGVTVPDLLVPPQSRTVRRGRPPRIPVTSAAEAPAGSTASDVEGTEKLEETLRQAASLAAHQGSRTMELTENVKDVLTALETAVHGLQGSARQARSEGMKSSREFLSKAGTLARKLLASKPIKGTPKKATVRKATSKP